MAGACNNLIAKGTIRVGFLAVVSNVSDSTIEDGATCRFKNLTSETGQHLNEKLCEIVEELDNGRFSCEYGGDAPIAVKAINLDVVQTYTKWRHLSCMDFTNIKSVGSLDGFDALTEHKQGTVEKRLGQPPSTRPYKKRKRDDDWY